MQGPATAAARVALRLRQFSGLRATTSRESLPLLARWPRRMALSALAGPVAPAPDSGNQEKKRAGRGARPGRGRPEKGRAPGGTHQLLESDPLYQPLLPTGADAEGHRCGFVAIIGRPNAGKVRGRALLTGFVDGQWFWSRPAAGVTWGRSGM